MKKNVFYRWLNILSLLALFVLGRASWWIQQHIKTEQQEEIKASLESLVLTLQESLDDWLAGKFSTVSYWADRRVIQQSALQLLQSPLSQSELIEHPSQQTFRAWFKELKEAHPFQGFFLISPEGLSLASSRDVNIGTLNLLWQDQDFVKQVLAGEIAVSKMVKSDVPLLNRHGQLEADAPTFFVGAPVRNSAGEIIAVFTLRMDPDQHFTQVLVRGRIGQSGDAYLLDKQVHMISRPRFEKQLIHIGLLQKNGSGIEVRNPGQNLFKISYAMPYDTPLEVPATAPDITPKKWPLTHLASELAAGRSGSSMTPYRDYRGVPVVGAWIWDKKLGLGIALEQDASEAYKSLNQFLWTLKAFTVLAALLLAGLSLVFYISQRLLLRGEAALADSEEQMRTLFNSAGEGIFLMDEDTFIDCNPKAVSIFGCTRADIIGQSPVLFSPEFQPNGEPSIEAALVKGKAALGGEPQSFYWRHRRLDLSEFDAEVSLNCVNIKGKLYVQAITRDITERKQAELAREQAKDAAEAANAIKSRFLMNMSHQFRTPLNAILGFAQLINKESSEFVIQKWSSQLLDSGQCLLDLLNNILESIKLESGELAPQNKTTDLFVLLESLQAYYGDQAQKKDLKFRLSQADALPRFVSLDGDKVRLVLESLLDNAVNYTSVGEIELEVELCEPEADNTLLFRVKDTGQGISLTEQGRIFGAFEQVIIGAEANSGAGLGLALARGYVEMMGGELGLLDSETGQGACFYFTLPFKLVSEKSLDALSSKPDALPEQDDLVLPSSVDHISLDVLPIEWLKAFALALDEVDQDQLLDLLASAEFSEVDYLKLREWIEQFELEKLAALVGHALSKA